MEQAVKDFIQGKRVALVGLSRNGKKFGNSIFTELTQRGYQVFPVHPSAQEIGGEKCYPSLDALSGQVDGLLVCVSPQGGAQVLRDAAAAGVKNVWLQQGAESPELVQIGKELNLNLVSGKCILMYAPPVRSFHAFHRAFVKIIGKL